jgi:ferrochelatase
MSSANAKTAALLIGFGGPNHAAEVRPFIEDVLAGFRVPPGRVDEVAGHYYHFGGVSPYNAVTFAQRAALERWFAAHGGPAWVGVGMRHARPTFRDAFQIFKRLGVERVIGFVLAGFRSEASYERYLARVAEGKRQADAESLAFEVTEPFFEDRLFVDAQAARVQDVFDRMSDDEKRETYVLFSAHSIPIPMAVKSEYDTQFVRNSALVAHRLGLGGNWQVAYQSRSGPPDQAWLVPSIVDVIRAVDRSTYRHVVVVPNGFLCDNVEVLYDLDVEAREACEKAGLTYRRAGTVGDHPAFIEMMARKILQRT